MNDFSLELSQYYFFRNYFEKPFSYLVTPKMGPVYSIICSNCRLYLTTCILKGVMCMLCAAGVWIFHESLMTIFSVDILAFHLFVDQSRKTDGHKYLQI